MSNGFDPTTIMNPADPDYQDLLLGLGHPVGFTDETEEDDFEEDYDEDDFYEEDEEEDDDEVADQTVGPVHLFGLGPAPEDALDEILGE